MSFGEAIAPFLGRLLMAWFFLSEAYRYMIDWRNMAVLLSMKSVPAPGLLLFVGSLGLFAGSLSLLLGYRTRAGALLLFAITLAATLTLNDYWRLAVAEARHADYAIFVRNIAIAGGLLLIVGMGAGSFALDRLRPRGGFYGTGWYGRSDY